MHSIRLGYTKESALLTLKDLKELKKTIGTKRLIVAGIDGKNTVLSYRSPAGLIAETEGISGYGCVINALIKYDKCVKGLQNFTVPVISVE